MNNEMEQELNPQQERGNVILSGFMGSGKTAVGRRLAAILQMEFVDMDRYIEDKAGMKIIEIFAQYGEEYFRTLETQAVKALSDEKRYVIATGGGTLMRAENAELFRKGGGEVFYLNVPLRALQERLKNDKRRPLLQVPDRNAVIEKLLNERTPKYLATADHVVDAGAPTVVVVRRICALCGVEPDERKMAKQSDFRFRKKGKDKK